MESQYAIPRAPAQVAEQLGRFFTKVYTWMALGLALTGFVAAYLFSQPSMMAAILGNTVNVMLLVIVELALVFILSARIQKLRVPTAMGMFIAYAALNGVLFSTIFLAYTGQSIAQVFFITAGTFGAMSVYGYVTKKDLTRIGQLAVMALFGLIIAMVVNFFFRSEVFSFLTSIIGVVIFVALTAYDTQKLKRLALEVPEGSEAYTKGAIIGALALYLDFINLFLMLLRLLGRRR